jgi:hypothetical protein
MQREELKGCTLSERKKRTMQRASLMLTAVHSLLMRPKTLSRHLKSVESD